MSNQTTPQDDPEKSAVQLLQEINSGLTDPKLLDAATRQRCIETLIGEGYTVSHIAQVLKRNEKTIRRDIKEIHGRHALTPNVEFAKEFIGQAVRQAMNHCAYLMRIARSKETPPGDRAQSEFLAWRVLKELIEALQRLGYLPLKPSELIVSHQDSDASLEDIEKTVIEMQGISQETGTDDPQFRQALEKIQADLEKTKLAQEVAKLKEQQKINQENEGEQHG